MSRLRVVTLSAALLMPAVAAAERAERSTPGSPGIIEGEDAEAALERGRQLHDAGDYEGAILLYRALLKKHPRDPQVRYELMYSTHVKGDHETARQIGEELLKQVENLPPAVYVLLGTIYDTLDDPKKGEATFREGLTKHADFALLHFNLGVNLAQQKKYAEAQGAFLEALKRNPRHPSSWLSLSVTAQELDLRASAFLAAARFLTLEPDSKRSPGAAGVLWPLLFEGVTMADQPDEGGKNRINIRLTVDGLSEEAKRQGTFLALVAAGRYLEEWEKKSDHEWFVKGFGSVVAIFGQRNPDPFWKACVIDYFDGARAAGHLEALAYDIRRSLKDPAIGSWLEGHAEAAQKYREWSKAWSSPGCAP